MSDFKRLPTVNGVPVSLDGHTHGVGPSTEYWSDLIVPLACAKQAATNKPVFNAAENGYTMPDNSSSHVLYFTVTMPLDWDAGSTVYPMVHAHRAGEEAPGFIIAYRWTSIGEAVSNWSTMSLNDWIHSYHGVSIHDIAYNPDGLYPYYGAGHNSELQIKLYRGNSPYNASIVATVFTLRYKCNSLGFTSLLAK
jgi:hypothetical protein